MYTAAKQKRKNNNNNNNKQTRKKEIVQESKRGASHMKSGRVVDVANGFLLQCGCCNIVGEGKKKARGNLRRGRRRRTTTTTTRQQEQEGKQEQEEEKKLNFECIEETQHFPSMKTKF
jgi:hypothetical protein